MLGEIISTRQALQEFTEAVAPKIAEAVAVSRQSLQSFMETITPKRAEADAVIKEISAQLVDQRIKLLADMHAHGFGNSPEVSAPVNKSAI